MVCAVIRRLKGTGVPKLINKNEEEEVYSVKYTK